MKRTKKGKMASPKALKGKLAQVDTLSEKSTMGNPRGGKRSMKAREKRLERASV